jgi:hypothetical protein
MSWHICNPPHQPQTCKTKDILLTSSGLFMQVWDTAFDGSSSDGGETLALRWETTELRKMGSVLTAFFAAQARGFATTAVGNAVVGATFGLLNIPRALMGIASMIDDTWAVCQLRADLAGKELAEVGKRVLTSCFQHARRVTASRCCTANQSNLMALLLLIFLPSTSTSFPDYFDSKLLMVATITSWHAGTLRPRTRQQAGNTRRIRHGSSGHHRMPPLSL